MNTGIKFGTSGWRARIAEDFTYQNLKRVTHAIAKHIKNNKDYGVKGEEYLLYLKNRKVTPPKMPPVVIGYDTRYLSEVYARIAAESLIAENIPVIFSPIETPTPVVAWEVIKNNAIGGIMITASHNPPQYNGLKWTPFWGGPATSEITSDIELYTNSLTNAEIAKTMSFHQGVFSKLIREIDFHKSYTEQILSIIDKNLIKKARLKVACDYNHGAARTYLGDILEKLGAKVIHIKSDRNITFEGKSPDTDEENLKELITTVKKNKLHLGLAADGDADRFGIIDSDGSWISPNAILALVLHHLVKNKGLTGKVARSVMTSNFVDAVAKSNGMEIRETPVGFKHIGNLLRTGQYVLGGEESAGLSIMNHVPEKDGILACLLVAELAAKEKKPLKKIIADLSKKTGFFFNKRHNIPVKNIYEVETLTERLKSSPPLNIAGDSVWRINEMDGFKFILKDGSWIGIRPSGTEPIVRLYGESSDKRKLGKMLDMGKKIILGQL
jgi:phosphomannomutase